MIDEGTGNGTIESDKYHSKANFGDRRLRENLVIWANTHGCNLDDVADSSVVRSGEFRAGVDFRSIALEERQKAKQGFYKIIEALGYCADGQHTFDPAKVPDSGEVLYFKKKADSA